VKPLILLSNDDGVRAPGIQALADALVDVADLVIAAPDRERSAAAHSISLDHPLRAEEVEPGVFAIDGTPVDCVYLALHHLVPRKPDLCLSGINNGFNLGSDVFYSGTVGAALEGALRGIPSIALSLERRKPQDFTHAAAFARDFVGDILARGADALEPGILLNVNFPAGPVVGCAPRAWGGESIATKFRFARTCAGVPTTGSAVPRKRATMFPVRTAPRFNRATFP